MHTGWIWGFSVEKWRTESLEKNVSYCSIWGGQTLTPHKTPLGASKKVPPVLFGYPWVRSISWHNNLSLLLRLPGYILFPGASQQQLKVETERFQSDRKMAAGGSGNYWLWSHVSWSTYYRKMGVHWFSINRKVPLIPLFWPLLSWVREVV